MCKLIIDTHENKKISVGLEIKGKKRVIEEDATRLKSQACLILIEKILEKNNKSITNLKEIIVNKGPGSFTGLRVGISIANSLAYILKIPVNGKRVGDLEEPVYA